MPHSRTDRQRDKLAAYLGRRPDCRPGLKQSVEVKNLYEAGAVRNIAAFHRNIVEERYGNGAVVRWVDGTLATILAREAAAAAAPG